MRAVDLIIKKRNNEILSKDEIDFMINGYVNNTIPDYQVASFLMAIFFNGLSFEETKILTDSMIKSGEKLDFSYFTGIKVDKHSTGGVGDKLSLIIAPIAASCGCIIPMMSGRGLGHTGGTLDKFESIPWYNVFPDPKTIDTILNECSFVMMGQTDTFVPADKKIYALRDVTGTVESIPLITASIMSKKIAEGSNALVIDLKCGKGAFMKTKNDALCLAEFMMGVSKASGVDMRVVISDMNTPLGREVGNYNEVIESYEALSGRGELRMMELAYRLAGWMIFISQKAGSIEEGVYKAKNAVESGAALDYFMRNITLQGGDIDYITHPKVLYSKSVRVKANKTGYINSIDAYKIGIASMYIECGRKTKDSPIDHYAGISLLKLVGEYVTSGDEIFNITYNRGDIENCLVLCNDAIVIDEQKMNIESIIIEELG
ncbi:MAG: thymidine phosphorylase [Spirochaetes bacterium GWF1_31_7]|nr:MAG: thymidine phosphorylase [Spirochaetes bacterium GWE1_32_154]OHD47948.1 MAG: thymidine phosphorylase [Spirochaetes bacterium GWE2_31_10]OHD49827.1 MAG: thymidine phosphorylase [Spirochaetes bacterium GWF1_31_7]HBD92928.1 thymidine phosphorylase [Spirochaetia bacterium]HBI37805.1 thymidine phosphorylase [Spirochaetia bacterium]